ncbi:MAG: type II toxin-antitoxin system Phd/YefM family antitoxin [Caulobacterales bacterium]
MADVTLADAKARLSELVARAAQGDSVRITRRGKPVAQLGPLPSARKPVELAALQAVTDAMPLQTETAAETVRRMRDEARY